MLSASRVMVGKHCVIHPCVTSTMVNNMATHMQALPKCSCVVYTCSQHVGGVGKITSTGAYNVLLKVLLAIATFASSMNHFRVGLQMAMFPFR